MYIMKKIKTFKNLCLWVVLYCISASGVSYALTNSVSLGAVAGNIHGSASILARVMWAACVIVGIALLLTAFSQFQINRRNPKLMPLTTPIMYLILALICLAIPFAERIFNFEDSYQQENQTAIPENYTNIDR